MKNTKAMDAAVETALSILKKDHRLTPVDPGRFGTLKVYGVMKFWVEQYHVEGIGNLSVMRMKMGLPLMTMATVVVTPFEKNLPLMSVDFIYMVGNRRAYIEFYDLVARKDKSYLHDISRLAAISQRYAALPPCPPASAWYDQLLTATIYRGGKAADDPLLIDMLGECVRGFAEMCAAAPQLDGTEQAEKRRITAEYVDTLVKQGGTSTNVFKKAFGEETTREFFGKVFFGTGSFGKV